MHQLVYSKALKNKNFIDKIYFENKLAKLLQRLKVKIIINYNIYFVMLLLMLTKYLKIYILIKSK